MDTKLVAALCLCLTPIFALASEPAADVRKNWPQWRGPNADGVAPHGTPPVEWNEKKNIRWKVEIPGKGHATPIIWGNYIFIQTAIETEQEGPPRQNEPASQGRRHRGPPSATINKFYDFAMLALNRADGKVAWRKTLRHELPNEGRTHQTASLASGSPVTDGKMLYAYFGSRGLYCLDMKGNVQWEKDLGDMKTRRSFGEGSSPVVHGDKIAVNWDHEGESFVVVLDKQNGNELWRRERDERTSWATPLVVEHGGKSQLIVSATNRVRSYDLDTGDLLWETSGMTTNVIPSPVFAHGLVYVTSGYRGNALLAIDVAKASGDITGSEAIVWSHDRDTPYTPSPLLHDNKLYFLKRNNAILSCLDAKSGEVLYGPQRLEGMEGVYASPVAAAGRVYIAGRDGTTVVIKQGATFELLARNSLDDGFDASPAIVGNELYLRGNRFLYCIAED